MKVILVTLFWVSLGFAQKDPNWLDGRNTIVHLFEWKWSDIATECETVLGPNGYAAVQISPVTENVIINTPFRPWWERYQPISYNFITRSGDEAALIDMIQRCGAQGIRIYADISLNHMTGIWDPAVGTGGSVAYPNEKNYPAVPYTIEHFHESCQINDYNSSVNVRNCELFGLRDLMQESDYVSTKIIEVMNRLIDLGVSGFRIDGAKYMWPEDLAVIYNRLNNIISGGRPFIYQEVIEQETGEAISRDEYTSMGVVTEFRHSAEIGRMFRGYDLLAYLQNWGEDRGFLASADSLVFVDNHDNQRGHGPGGTNILNYKSAKHYKMATAFMLAYPYGITRIMSSYFFIDSDNGPPADAEGNVISPEFNADGSCTGGWICEHRWKQISNMIGFKAAVGSEPVTDWWTNGEQQIAFCRGNKGFIAFNNGGDLDASIKTCLPEGVYCDVISGSFENGACTGKAVTVASNGKADIYIFSGEDDGVLALHVDAKLL